MGSGVKPLILNFQVYFLQFVWLSGGDCLFYLYIEFDIMQLGISQKHLLLFVHSFTGFLIQVAISILTHIKWNLPSSQFTC